MNIYWSIKKIGQNYITYGECLPENIDGKIKIRQYFLGG